jgi:drug/metabolite transporter (DMT)-like permease
VYGVLLLQALIASGTHVVANVIVRDMDPVPLTLTRSVIATAGMTVLLLVRGRWPAIRREDYGLVIWLSILAIPLNQFLYLYGMKFTIPANAALLYSTTPIIVLLFARWMLGERLTGKKIAGVTIGIAGVTIVILERGVSASGTYLFGNVVVFIAVLAWALYAVGGKQLIARYGAIEASALTMIGGTIVFLPFGLVSAVNFPFSRLTTADWCEIAYLGIATSVFSYLLWYYALGRIEAGKAAVFSNLQPVLTTVLALVILGQGVTLPFVVGGTLALCGVVIVQIRTGSPEGSG